MRILYFSGIKVPSQSAQSVHAMKTAEAFAHAGHDVILFAKGVDGATESEIFEAYNTDPCFQLEFSTFVSIPLISGAARWLDMSGKVRRWPAPDLVYGADPIALSLLCPSSAKIMLEAHNLPEHSSQIWALHKLIKHPNFLGIVATTEVLKQGFISKFPTINADKIFVAHDGADLISRHTDQTSEPLILKGKKQALNVGYIGSLHAGKGISLITRIAELRPEYEFHIVGGTEKHITKYYKDLYSDNLHFYGHRNHADIPAYLKAFDIVLAPYQNETLVKARKNTSHWLSPIKIFEYMAAAKPILCSDLPVLREILQHEYNALLLPSGDASQWAKALDTLKTNPQLAKSIALNGYRDLAKNFTWDKRAEAILSFSSEKPAIFRRAAAS